MNWDPLPETVCRMDAASERTWMYLQRVSGDGSQFMPLSPLTEQQCNSLSGTILKDTIKSSDIKHEGRVSGLFYVHGWTVFRKEPGRWCGYVHGWTGGYFAPAISALPPSLVVVFRKEPGRWFDYGGFVAMSIQIIYQDEYIVAVNKPQALLSVPGLGPNKQDCLISRLVKVIPEARVVHRLDCYTSGIMLFAIGIEMQRALSRIFHDRKIQKQYIAVVKQWFDENEGVIKFPMRCDIDNRPHQIVDYEHGKSAVTFWQVLQRKNDAVRLLLKPVTGRTHQLRVHCAAMGYPIIGDGLYSDDNDEIKQPRMLLHADNLLFEHPVTNKEMHLFAECEF